MTERIKDSFSSVLRKSDRAIIHLLIVLFGVSAWIGVNGIFVQTPLLVNASPQAWELPAYLVILIQAANVVPAAYTLAQHFTARIHEVPCIVTLLSIGTLAMGLLIFYYDKTSVINAASYSTALFVLTFFTALVGCSSSVVFMPYIRSFQEVYLVSYFIGEGLSGVLPSVLALIQGVSGGNRKCVTDVNNKTELITSEPRFTSDYYFLCLFIILLLSLVSFLTLQYIYFPRAQRGSPQCMNVDENTGEPRSKSAVTVNFTNAENSEHRENTIDNDAQKTSENDNVAHPLPIVKFYLLTVMGAVCFFGNGFFPSIQSYSCMPYGTAVYHLSVTLSQFANPGICFVAFWFLPRTLRAIHCMLLGIIITGGYVTYLGMSSPSPVLQHSASGKALVIVSWVIVMGLTSYTKLIIASIFRCGQEAGSLFRAGIVMQIGSACGAIVSFTLIKCTTYFKTYDPCLEIVD